MKSCANFVLRLLVQLSGEVIEDITCGFKKGNFAEKINGNFILCDGFLSGYQSRVLIKRITEDCGAISKQKKHYRVYAP
jgi:hypothetical protein